MSKIPLYGNCSQVEFSEMISSLEQAWLQFIEKGIRPEELPREILSSWERCKLIGVDPLVQVNESVNIKDLMMQQERNEKLLNFARPVMRQFYQVVEGSETILTLSDHNGLIMEMCGDDAVIRKAASRNFIPGSIWSEEVAGTNAIGTVIKEKKPIQILFAEHFCNGWHEWTCAAAPILNPLTGELVGVLDITGKKRNAHPHTLGLAVSIARNITMHIEKALLHDGLHMNPFLLAALSSLDEGVMITDANKNILRMNARMEFLLGANQIKGHLNAFPEIDRLADLVLGRKESLIEQEISLIGERNKFICVIRPVAADQQSPIGLLISLRKHQVKKQGTEEKSRKPAHPSTRYTFQNMVGVSPAFVKLKEKAQRAAFLDSTVLLSGETGVGKELFAQAIHNASERREKPFIAVNCGAIPRELIESELFGYVAGAFTGARRDGSPGKFELADGGTIFLDEIGEMPLEVQVHLLRVLEERAVMRIGGSRLIPVNVRVIAATHKNLTQAVQEGKFRADLYFRLRVIELKIPALRERMDDIPLLAKHFVSQLSHSFGKQDIEIDPRTVECLKTYAWPGNIRELKNVMEQALFNMEGRTILPCDLPPELVKQPRIGIAQEQSELITALEASGWNVPKAAERLGISRATFYRKLKEFNITCKQLKKNRL